MIGRHLLPTCVYCILTAPSVEVNRSKYLQPKEQTSKKQKNRLIDTCVIRTHAPEVIALAGQRVNHSAKVP